MAKSIQNTLRRDRPLYVKFMNILCAILPAGPSPLRHLSDAQARDIGIDPASMERLRYEYPSRTTQHPRL